MAHDLWCFVFQLFSVACVSSRPPPLVGKEWKPHTLTSPAYALAPQVDLSSLARSTYPAVYCTLLPRGLCGRPSRRISGPWLRSAWDCSSPLSGWGCTSSTISTAAPICVFFRLSHSQRGTANAAAPVFFHCTVASNMFFHRAVASNMMYKFMLILWDFGGRNCRNRSKIYGVGHTKHSGLLGSCTARQLCTWYNSYGARSHLERTVYKTTLANLIVFIFGPQPPFLPAWFENHGVVVSFGEMSGCLPSRFFVLTAFPLAVWPNG